MSNMTIMGTNSFADRLCKLLKIENERIMKIEIIIAPRDVVEIIIHKAMTNGEGESILMEIDKISLDGTYKKD